MTPSFYPRPWLAQGVLSGASLALGYGVGAGTGALIRRVVRDPALLIITPTGTGSVNAFAIDPLEYMYDGNTATVAMQYSYAPSG